MTDVFISYSRKDKDFVQQLHVTLTRHQRDPWIDWEDIPPTADWWQEIEAGIEGADAFAYVISPDSIASQVCYREIEHAAKYNKRIVPILRRDGFDQTRLHRALSEHNWLFFRPEDDFEQSFQALLKAMDTDLEYVRSHTRLLLRTLEWDNKGRSDSFLLRGEDLAEAEAWLAKGQWKEPKPTEQQHIYIKKSREVEDINQQFIQKSHEIEAANKELVHKNAEIEAANRTLKRAQRQGKRIIVLSVTGLAIATLASIIATVLGWQAKRQVQQAQQISQIERQSRSALQFWTAGQQIDALIAAVRSAQGLQALLHPAQPFDYPTTSPLLALQTVLSRVQEQNRLTQHEGWVRSVNFSPDGQHIVTASFDKTAILWDRSGQRVHRLEGHTDVLFSASFSPDGQRIVTTSADGTARLWDLTGEEVATFKVAVNGDVAAIVRSASISPDGRWLVTGADDQTTRLWDLQLLNSTKRVFEPSESLLLQGRSPGQQHSGAILSVSFSPNGQQIATASSDATIRLWTLQGQPLTVLQGHQGWVWSIRFSPDGKTLVSGSSDRSIRLWDVATQTLIHSIEGQESIYGVSVSPDGNRLATATSSGTIQLWKLNAQRHLAPLDVFRGHQDAAWSVSFSPDGQTLASGSSDRTVRLWTLDRQAIVMTDPKWRIFDADISPNGQQIATTSRDGTVRLWTPQGRQIAAWKPPGDTVTAWSVRYSPDGQSLAIGTQDSTDITQGGTVYLWTPQADPDRRIKTLFKQPWAVLSVSFSPNGQQIATSSSDRITRVWNLQGPLEKTLVGHRGPVWKVSFSPDGTYLATASDDGTARLWNLQEGRSNELKGHRGRLWDASFSPDGQHVVTSSEDRTARLWNLQGQEIRQLTGHQDAVRGAKFSPNGQSIVTVSADRTARLWNLNGDELGEFEGHHGRLFSVSVSPDSRFFVTTSDDQTARIWTIETLDELVANGCQWLGHYLATHPNGVEPATNTTTTGANPSVCQTTR